MIEDNYLEKILRFGTGWKGAHVRFAKPYVNRIRFIFGDYRICLHEILPCRLDEPMWHSHPWETTFRLVKGNQEVGLGRDHDREFHGQGYTLQPKTGAGENSPAIEKVKAFNPGNIYQMDAIDDWHYVLPLDKASYSIMINGPQAEVRERPKGFGERMSEAEVERYKDLWLTIMDEHFGSW